MKLLFVCTGNTCRSCMAEAIFNKLCTLENTIAFSAGISVVKNSVTSEHSALLTKENYGVDISKRRAVQLTKEMLEEADLVLTMNSYMKELLINNFQNLKNKIYSLNEYVGIRGNITDPFGGDIIVYSKTFNDIKKSILLLLDKLKEDKSTL